MGEADIVERLARLEARIEALDKLRCAEAQAIDLRFRASEKSVETALASAEKAVTKSEVASEKRFESVNEFRQSLADSQRLNIPRMEVENLAKASAEKIEAVNKFSSEKIEAVHRSVSERMTQMGQTITEKVDRQSAEVASLSAIVTGLNLRREGSSEGKKEGYGWIAAMIALAIAITQFLSK